MNRDHGISDLAISVYSLPPPLSPSDVWVASCSPESLPKHSYSPCSPQVQLYPRIPISNHVLNLLIFPWSPFFFFFFFGPHIFYVVFRFEIMCQQIVLHLLNLEILSSI